MRLRSLLKVVAGVGAVAAVGGGGYATRDRWLPLVQPAEPSESPTPPPHDHGPPDKLTVSPQAQQAMRLNPRPLVTTTFWKTATIPGTVVERPGAGDRAVPAPAAGVVTAVHRHPGDTIRGGDELFTIRLLSESLYTTQTELFKATAEIALVGEQRKRLTATPGAVPEARVIEADNQLSRLRTAVVAYRQELLNRGLRAEQVDAAAAGRFVVELTVSAPPAPPDASAADGPGFELQELKTDLGQQVQPGQTLAVLSDHRRLAVEGRAYREELPALERSVRNDWPVATDFGDDATDWPPAPPLGVRYLSNTIDPATRTFAFRAPLDNPSRTVERDGRPIRLWRFRPGQAVRLEVRTDKLDGVFVLPPAAVVREGGETYLFRQNGDDFDRRPVRVVHQDRRAVVVADDGSVPAGVYVTTAGALQLNRMLKAAAEEPGGGGGHVHADGTTHAAH